MDPKAVSAHVILSNTHLKLGKWGEKMNVRKRLRSLGIKKAPGCSWIELESNVHWRLTSLKQNTLIDKDTALKEKNYAIKREGKDYVLAEI
ncbi:pentatricopeptide repeat-containing protein [Quercus suber]|uniref:Pentatricopeptide repeat-containing protein n=1 Tax=Quercus suber TaxID=58331 RepID=A0AAW0KT27_QUESU